MFELLLGGFLLVVVIGILIAASRSAKRGRRYIGSDDPIETYENNVDSAWAFPYGRYFPWASTVGFRNWRQRVKMQAQLDAERHEEERGEAREARERREAPDDASGAGRA